MNQADFLVSSPAKVAKPMKASVTSGVKTSTRDRSDFSSRLQQASETNNPSSTKSKSAEPHRDVSRKQNIKDVKPTQEQLSNEQTRKLTDKKDVESAQNVEQAQDTELQVTDSELANNKLQNSEELSTSDENALSAHVEETLLSSKAMELDVEAMPVDEALVLQAEVAKEEVQLDTNQQNEAPQQYVKGVVLDEGEEILSQLNSANQMLKVDSVAIEGKELPQGEQNSVQPQALMHSVAQYEATQAEDMTEFTAAMAPTKPLLSQLLDKMNANQMDSDREAYIQQLAEKEGLNNEQLQLLEQAIEKIDIKQLQVAMHQNEQEMEFLLEHEPALRDAFVVQILMEGSEDPQLEEILTQLKADSYQEQEQEQEVDADVEQIPPKLMLELSAYIEAKQVIHQQIKAQENEKEQLASDAFLLGTGFGAGLATAELTSNPVANTISAPIVDSIMPATELHQQARVQANKQELTAWQLLQAQQSGDLASDDIEQQNIKAQMELPKGAQIDPEMFTAQLGQSNNVDKQLQSATQMQGNRSVDFSTQLASMSSAGNALQDVQQSSARVANQQAIDTPIKLAQQGQVAPELSNKVNMMLSRDLKQIDIRLDPPELGKVHIKLALNNDQAHLNFTVTHAHARDAIEHSIPRLREMLAQQGVDLGQTNVDQEQSQARDFSSMLAGDGSTQSSENGETSNENMALNSDGEEIEVHIDSSVSDAAVDFYA